MQSIPISVKPAPAYSQGPLLHGIAALILTILAVCLSLDTAFADEGPSIRSAPNIILVLADDLGFSDLGCYGGEISTPNLDQLAKNGLRFTQFYNCGRGCPTRAALLTGLYPHQTGVGLMMNDYRRPGYRGNLNNSCITIAQLLHTAGYETYAAGKWHLSRYVAPEGPKFNWPLQRGFDRFYGTIHGAGSYFDPVTLCRDNQFVRREQSGEYYYTDAISRHAAGFVEQAGRSDKPFFLYVAYTAPHWPLHAPRQLVSRYRGRYAAGWDELRTARYQRTVSLRIIKPNWPLTDRDPRTRPWVQSPNKSWQQRRMEVYAAQVDAMDRGIGLIMEKVRQIGQERNTLVIFLSDNGGCAEEINTKWQGPHIPARTHAGGSVVLGNSPNVLPGPEGTYQSCGIAWANVSNTPFRLYKHFVHEGGIATPLIAYWPSVITSRGKLTNQVGHVIDLMPTCAEVAKIRYPSHLGGHAIEPAAGRSLIPVFLGGARQVETFFWEHEGNRAVREGKWKLVSRHPNSWELYDIEADRTELDDLAARFPVIVQDLAQAYERWAKQCNVEKWRKK